MKVDAEQINKLEKRFRTLFINSLTGFKSANLVGSCSENGTSNIAVFSSLFHLGASPPLIGMVSRPHLVTRDTLENITATGSYTINHVNKDIYRQAHQTSARYDAGISEFDAVELEQEWHENIQAPFVKQSRIQLGMALRDIKHVDINNTEIIIGEIVFVNIKDDVVRQDGYVDIESAGSVAVSSLDTYHGTSVLESLSYAKTDRQPETIRIPDTSGKKTDS